MGVAGANGGQHVLRQGRPRLLNVNESGRPRRCGQPQAADDSRGRHESGACCGRELLQQVAESIQARNQDVGRRLHLGEGMVVPPIEASGQPLVDPSMEHARAAFSQDPGQNLAPTGRTDEADLAWWPGQHRERQQTLAIGARWNTDVAKPSPMQRAGGCGANGEHLRSAIGSGHGHGVRHAYRSRRSEDADRGVERRGQRGTCCGAVPRWSNARAGQQERRAAQRSHLPGLGARAAGAAREDQRGTSQGRRGLMPA